MELTVLAWTFTGLPFVLVAACLAAGRGAIPRIPFCGIQTPSLMRSDTAWQAGHTATAIPAAVAVAVGLTSISDGLAEPVAYWGAIVALLSGLVWVFITSSRAAKASVHYSEIRSDNLQQAHCDAKTLTDGEAAHAPSQRPAVV